MQELQDYIVPSDMSVKSDLSMKDFGKILRRRSRLITTIVVLTLIVAIACSLLPHRDYATSQVLLIQRVPSAQMNAQESYAAPWIEQVATPLDELQTPMAYDMAIAWMKNDATIRGVKPPAFDQSTFPKHVAVANTKGSNTIDITAWAYSPKDAYELAYAAAASFVQWKNQQAQHDVDQAIEDYRHRVADARADLALAQDRELRFKTQYHFADLDTEEKNYLNVMSSQQAALLNAKQTAASEDAKLASLQSQLGGIDRQIASASGIRDDVDVQSIQAKLYESEMELNSDKLHYTPLYPNKLGDVNQHIADYKRELSSAIQGTIDHKRPSLQDQDAVLTAWRNQQAETLFADASLKATEQSYNQLFSQHLSFPVRDMEFLRLDQDLQTKTGLYQSLNTALTEAITDQSSISGDVQMTAPTAPNEFNRITYTILFTLGGLLMGFFIAGCAVLLVEQSDQRLHTTDEVRRLLSGPVIGALPVLRDRERKALSRGVVPNHIADVFNVARNNLQLVMRHYTQHDLWDKQVLVFASAGSDEGKSLFATQIARSIAKSGRTVVYIDANLRSDKEREALAPNASVGLAQVLAKGVDIDSVIVDSGTENLTIVPSGPPIDTHTTDLIASPAMSQAIEKLRARADVVIVDTPACAQATDALYLAPHADAVIQVIALAGMDETVLADTISALHAASPKVIAYAMNRIPRPKRRAGRTQYYALELNGLSGKANGSLTGGVATPMLTADANSAAADRQPSASSLDADTRTNNE